MFLNFAICRQGNFVLVLGAVMEDFPGDVRLFVAVNGVMVLVALGLALVGMPPADTGSSASKNK